MSIIISHQHARASIFPENNSHLNERKKEYCKHGWIKQNHLEHRNDNSFQEDKVCPSRMIKRCESWCSIVMAASVLFSRVLKVFRYLKCCLWNVSRMKFHNNFYEIEGSR